MSIIAERLYVARVADHAKLAFTNGILSAAGSAGSVFGPVMGGFLALADLRVPFIVVGVTASLAAVSAIAQSRNSTSFCSADCGGGMNSSLDAITVGIGGSSSRPASSSH